jgi:copper chaperone CopZ
VRSALLEVKGVSRATVSLDNHEATATFDPRQTNVQDLIAAVNRAQGPADFIKYSAWVKEVSPR